MDTIYAISIGIATIVLGQIVIKMILDPVHDLKVTLGEIQYWLLETSPQWNNKITFEEKDSKELRHLANKLLTSINMIPFYRIVAIILSLPSKRDIIKSGRYIIGLSIWISNIEMAGANINRIEEICNLLNIYNPWENIDVLSMSPDL